MRKRLSEFEKDFESKVRKTCLEKNLEFLGVRNVDDLPEKQRYVANEHIKEISARSTDQLNR